MGKEKIKVLAIIQARVGSSRLPGKVLMKISGKAILEHVINRVKRSRLIDEVIVATALNRSNLAIVRLCGKTNTLVFCGDENNVMDRFYQAAKPLEPSHIVRITADCPMIDPLEIDRVIACHIKNGSDYTANSISEQCADGEDVEVFKFEAFQRACERAKLPSELEHVTMYFKNHPRQFELLDTPYEINLNSMRWTVDDPEDMVVAKKIFRSLYGKNKFFGIKEILNLLEKKPELLNYNKHIKRNMGLKKSLLEDTKQKQERKNG